MSLERRQASEALHPAIIAAHANKNRALAYAGAWARWHGDLSKIACL
jgi:hypothetical protein